MPGSFTNIKLSANGQGSNRKTYDGLCGMPWTTHFPLGKLSTHDAKRGWFSKHASSAGSTGLT